MRWALCTSRSRIPSPSVGSLQALMCGASPIEQPRAICRSPTRLPAIVLSSAATCLWKSLRRSRTQLRDRPETVRLHPGTGVHLHPGILFRDHPGTPFGIIPESCPSCPGFPNPKQPASLTIASRLRGGWRHAKNFDEYFLLSRIGSQRFLFFLNTARWPNYSTKSTPTTTPGPFGTLIAPSASPLAPAVPPSASSPLRLILSSRAPIAAQVSGS